MDDSKFRPYLILAVLFLAASIFGSIVYCYRDADNIARMDSVYLYVNIMRYILIGIGGVALLVCPNKSARYVIIISVLTIAVLSLYDSYLILFFNKAIYHPSLGDLLGGFVKLLIGAVLMINVLAYIMDPSKNLSAVNYCFIAYFILCLLEILFNLRHNETAITMVQSVVSAFIMILSMIYLMNLMSSKTVKHMSLFGSIKASVGRIMDAGGTNSGISIDRGDLKVLIDSYESGLPDGTVSFYLRSHYANIYRLVLMRSDRGIQMLVVPAKSRSMIGKVNFLLTDIVPNADTDECTMIRFYGEGHKFIQIIVSIFDDKFRKKLKKLVDK